MKMLDFGKHYNTVVLLSDGSVERARVSAARWTALLKPRCVWHSHQNCGI